jgi:hypothetical protein
MRREKVIFKLNNREIVFWNGYGVVAPNLWTTNGSFSYVARLTANYIEHGWKVTDSTLPADLDFTDEVALRDALRVAYLAWSKEEA